MKDERCNGCFYYYAEIGECMLGEPEVPDGMEKKCKEDKDNE